MDWQNFVDYSKLSLESELVPKYRIYPSVLNSILCTKTALVMSWLIYFTKRNHIFFCNFLY